MEEQKKTKQKELPLLASCIVPSFALLRKNDPLRLAGATAFFTTFALPPIVFLLAQLFGLFLSPKLVGRGLIANLADSLGTEGADQVRQVIRSIRGFNDHWYVIVLGFLFLFFVATTLFIVIKSSLNQLWQVSIKEKPGFIFGLMTRLRSFAVILLVGILFCANLIFKSIETMSGNFFEGVFKGSSFYYKLVFSELSGVIIVAVWFIMLFRFLADGKPKWKAAVVGGMLTALLFTAGRVILKVLLINGNVGQLYGSSGAFVLILLFVFYTSFILYYGACFIAVYSEKKQWKMKLPMYAFADNNASGKE